MTEHFGIRRFLARFEGFFDGIELLLSAIAVFLVLSNEFIGHDFLVPYLNVGWAHIQVVSRGITWAVFVGVFAVYGLTSGHLLKYARKHWLALLVCLTWIPYYNGGLLDHLTSLLSLQTLTLIGFVAHVWRLAQWTISRFREHPIIVVAACEVVLISVASAVLMYVEPQTFHNLSEAGWFCVQTIFTVGYGDIIPHTAIGKLVATTVMICGVGLGGVFIASMSKLIWGKLISHETQENNTKLEEHSQLLRELIAEQRKTNELLRKHLGVDPKVETESADASNPADHT